MDIIIQSLGFTASVALESFIHEKVGSLKHDRIIRANVTLYKGPSSNPDADYCEIRLEVPGNDHFVKKHSSYFETSVTACVDVLTKIINKSKEQFTRQADVIAIQDALLQAEDDNDEDVQLEDIVR